MKNIGKIVIVEYCRRKNIVHRYREFVKLKDKKMFVHFIVKLQQLCRQANPSMQALLADSARRILPGGRRLGGLESNLLSPPPSRPANPQVIDASYAG